MPTAFTKGKCLNCGEEFWYVRYRADKNYCKPQCRNRHYYVNKGTYSERNRRTRMSPEEFKEHKREYDRQRLQDPDIRARHNERQRRRYNTDVYRAYSRDRYYRIRGGDGTRLAIDHGYTGHRWFDLARQVVGEPPPQDSLYFDKWAERMGTAVLALLEGRDMAEAVKQHNKEQYVYENRQVYISDWTGENEYKQAFIGSEPSAEEATVAKENIALEVKARFSRGSNRRVFGNRGSHNGRTAPTRRRSFKPYQDRPGNRR